MSKIFEIEHYQNLSGKVPFQVWLEQLKDERAWSKVMTRLDRIERGSFGDCESVGSGVRELKIDYGPGYRVYFGKVGKKVILLLIGGTKKSQNADIKKAKDFWNEYKSR